MDVLSQLPNATIHLDAGAADWAPADELDPASARCPRRPFRTFSARQLDCPASIC